MLLGCIYTERKRMRRPTFSLIFATNLCDQHIHFSKNPSGIQNSKCSVTDPGFAGGMPTAKVEMAIYYLAIPSLPENCMKWAKLDRKGEAHVHGAPFGYANGVVSDWPTPHRELNKPLYFERKKPDVQFTFWCQNSKVLAMKIYLPEISYQIDPDPSQTLLLLMTDPRIPDNKHRAKYISYENVYHYV